MSREEDIDRPAASGHRFGPDLACSECGIDWETHQRDPHPCSTSPAETASSDAAPASVKQVDAFSRRPAAGASSSASPAPALTIASAQGNSEDH